MRVLMRGLVVSAALTMTLIAPALAQAEGLNNLYAGVNGLLTWPADPFVHIVTPPEEFEELPAHQVTSHMLGLFSGPLMALYRLEMAVADIVLSPFYVFPTLSPSPRWDIIPGVEYQ